MAETNRKVVVTLSVQEVADRLILDVGGPDDGGRVLFLSDDNGNLCEVELSWDDPFPPKAANP